MKNIYIMILAMSAFLFGVSEVKAAGSLPQCSDKEVIDVLKKIPIKQGEIITLSKITGIATRNREERYCTCIATGTYTNWVNLDTREIPIQYEIYLSDDGSGYNVSLSRR